MRDALLDLDLAALGGLDKAQLLLNSSVLHDAEKLQPLRDFAGAAERLVLPERFVREVAMAVPALRVRLGVLEFQALLPELAASCAQKLSLLRESVREVADSRRFATLLLDVILPLGNRLNAGSRGRVAAGFRISSLHRLVQTRASSGETFLQFVVAGLLERAPHLLELSLDFPSLLRATPQALSRDRVAADIARMEQGVSATSAIVGRSRGSAAQQRCMSATTAGGASARTAARSGRSLPVTIDIMLRREVTSTVSWPFSSWKGSRQLNISHAMMPHEKVSESLLGSMDGSSTSSLASHRMDPRALPALVLPARVAVALRPRVTRPAPRSPILASRYLSTSVLAALMSLCTTFASWHSANPMEVCASQRSACSSGGCRAFSR